MKINDYEHGGNTELDIRMVNGEVLITLRKFDDCIRIALTEEEWDIIRKMELRSEYH
jgi:hypothetical protein